jgi:hypothetical protein
MVGSTFLDARVKTLAPECHVFGHTHFGWDAVHDGVRYVQAPLAYPKEQKKSMNGPPGWAPFLLWSRAIAAAPAPWALPPQSASSNESSSNGLLDSGSMTGIGGGGGFVTYPQSTYWSDRSRTTVRDPENLKLAPWAKAAWG